MNILANLFVTLYNNETRRNRDCFNKSVEFFLVTETNGNPI